MDVLFRINSINNTFWLQIKTKTMCPNVIPSVSHRNMYHTYQWRTTRRLCQSTFEWDLAIFYNFILSRMTWKSNINFLTSSLYHSHHYGHSLTFFSKFPIFLERRSIFFCKNYEKIKKFKHFCTQKFPKLF